MGEIALVGAGPTASSLLERIAANRSELLPDAPLRIHLIDPHRAGTGRVWRPDQHPLLWMNSMAEDVTLFVDDSVECKGPAVDGPCLYEWAVTVDDETLRAAAPPELYDEIRGLTEMSFPTRRVQSVYLHWFHEQVVASLPHHVEVVRHTAAAVDIFDSDDRQTIVLDDGNQVTADVVVLALGHLDALPDDSGTALATFAKEHGLAYVPCGHTAEQDLSVLTPGTDVLVLGFGQAFTDLVALVTEGRGGSFAESGDGRLVYTPERVRARAARRLPPRRALPLEAALPAASPPRASPPLPRRPDHRRAAREPRAPRLLRRRAADRREGSRLGVLPRAVRRAPRTHDDAVGDVRDEVRRRANGATRSTPS